MAQEWPKHSKRFARTIPQTTSLCLPTSRWSKDCTDPVQSADMSQANRKRCVGTVCAISILSELNGLAQTPVIVLLIVQGWPRIEAQESLVGLTGSCYVMRCSAMLLVQLLLTVGLRKPSVSAVSGNCRAAPGAGAAARHSGLFCVHGRQGAPCPSSPNKKAPWQNMFVFESPGSCRRPSVMPSLLAYSADTGVQVSQL